MRKIGIIGVGHVGSHIASALINNDLVDKLYLYDNNEAFLQAQVNDLYQGSLLREKIPLIFMATLKDLLTCDIVINTATKGIAVSDRIDELKKNKEVIKEVFKDFNQDSFKGIILNVSNPCDVVASLILDYTKLKPNKVIASGTLLDSIRLKSAISKMYQIKPERIKALVIGEHGKSQVNVYSHCYIDDLALETYLKEHNLSLNEEELLRIVTRAGWDIFDIKHCTEFGIAGVCAFMVKQIYDDSNKIIPYSHPYYYEEKLIYTSTPAYLGKDGFKEYPELKLTSKEENLFKKSNEELKALIK